MGKVHNKKRNVGIIYEQIIKFICSKAIEGNTKQAQLATDILKENFSSNTQLLKEYKLFKALTETRGISESLGTSIINEAKKACNYHFDEQSLEFEKSKLIKDLNHNLGKGVIFKEQVKDYKMYATVQTLLNEWRKDKCSDISIIAKYESLLHKHMTTTDEVEIKENNSVIKENNQISKLVFNLMNSKFSKKYNEVLNENQKKMISMFIKDDDEIFSLYEKVKNETIFYLKEYKKECNNNILMESFDCVLNKVENLNEKTNTEENLKKFLYLCKLKEELIGEKNEYC